MGFGFEFGFRFGFEFELLGSGDGWCYWVALQWQWVDERKIGRETKIREKRECHFFNIILLCNYIILMSCM